MATRKTGTAKPSKKPKNNQRVLDRGAWLKVARKTRRRGRR